MQDRVCAEQHIERLRFRRAPLAAAAAWFAVGVLLARLSLHMPLQLVASLTLLAVLAFVALARESRAAWVPVAAVWIVLGVCAAEWERAPPAQTALLGYADNLSRRVQGHVVRVHVPAPQMANKDADQTPAWEAAEDTSQQRGRPITLDLAVDEIEEVTPDTSTMVATTGGIRVSVYEAGAGTHFACGDRLELPLRLKRPDRFRTPGAFQYADYLLAEGISAHGNVAASRIDRLGSSPADLRCRLYAAQAWASSRLTEYAQSRANAGLPALLRLSQADATMLDAMLFGDRTGLSHGLRTGFERTGTFHLFVVSGLHIALMAAGLYWLLRRARSPVWAATVLTLAGTSAYATVTGFGQPAQRALAMTAIFMLARVLTRDRDSLNGLGAAVLAMLVLKPGSLFDASFQMTVLVILAIAGIALPLVRRTAIGQIETTRLAFVRPRRVFAPDSAQRLLMLEMWGEAVSSLLPRGWAEWTRKLPALLVRVALRTAELGLISLVAEFVMVLPMAVYFHRLPVFAVPANMMILPLIALLVPAAVLTFLAALVSAKVALLPAAATSLLLHAVSFAIKRLSGLEHADMRIPGPAWWVGGAAVLVWIGCCWMVRRGRAAAWGAVVALPLVAASILWPEAALRTPGALEITALDVGQGDSILAVNAAGGTMLIDAGGPVGSHGAAETVSQFDVGEQVVAPYLWSRRMRRLDVLVVTHAHTDHMGGMPAILEDFRPRELWVGIDPRSELYTALLGEAGRLGIPVYHLHAGDNRQWGSMDVRVLAPAADYRNAAAPKNDDSLVLHMQFGAASVLLEGDAERPSEDTMLASGLVHPVTLLKVGHHGSKTSSNSEFLAAAQPEDAVISVGRNNTFGHPRDEVIERFAEAHTRLFRTDEFGLTTFLLTPDGRVRVTSGGMSLPP